VLPVRASRPTPGPARRERRSLLSEIDRGGWLIFAAQGLSGLGTAPFVVFGTIYQRQLGASAVEIGLISALGMLVATLSMIPGTGLAERYHLRPTIFAGWLLAIPGPVFYAVAPHWAFTAVGTVFLSVAVINTPAINVYLTLGVARDRLAMVMTLVLSSFSLCMIGSTLLSGWLAQLVGIRWVFFFSFLALSLAGVFVAFLPRKELPPEAGTTVRYRDLFRIPAFVALLVLFTYLTVVLFLPWAFTTLYAREVGHASDLWLGGLMAVFYLGSVMMGLLLSHLRRNLGSMLVVLSFETAFVASGIVLALGAGLPMLLPAFFLRGTFWSFRQVMTAVVGEALPPAAWPRGYGVFALATGAGAAIAYPLGGWLYARDPGMPFWWSAGLMGVGLAATFLARGHFGGGRLIQAPIQPALNDEVLPEAA